MKLENSYKKEEYFRLYKDIINSELEINHRDSCSLNFLLLFILLIECY